MRSLIFIACLLGIIGATCEAAPPKAKEKSKTLIEKIQGKWSRPNHPYSFVVEGKKFTEFLESKLKPNATGSIEIVPGKDYAVAKLDNGGVLWLFTAGENVLAVETFGPGAVIWEDGRVFYRPDFAP